MIDLYYFPTPNTWKVAIMLEECGLPYKIVPVDILNGEQLKPDFLAISPNNRVPAIVDQATGQSVFESGAILLYLAEKTGQFLPPSGAPRIAALEWLFWQVGGLGPMAGQAHVFLRYHPENTFAAERYTQECARLYGVLERRLDGRDWLADEYSIADMACWGWVWFHAMHGQALATYPSVQRWFFAMAKRPAVQRAKAVGLEIAPEEFRKTLHAEFYQEDPAHHAGETDGAYKKDK
jgi:GST-like protein